ncbi:1,4-dihydroxy-2-naphthoate octaprenyltransferase [Bifidobacterium goeldii]|nr:1,4-dihydroxy-2-naphthoate octaprenyltransferase [Bifidobacterium goeldii]
MNWKVWRLWVAGTRPRTLPASIAPVIVGAACAFRQIDMLGTCIAIYPVPAECVTRHALQQTLLARFWTVAVLCAAVALFLQIAVNFANDYSDGIRGTDDHRAADESQSGKPQRLTASGLVPPKRVLAAAGTAAALACIAGIAAIVISHSWWLFAVGAASLIAGWFYTGGRHPYGYAGFGELGVFVFFGLAATLGTQYALAGTLDITGILAAVCCGLNAMLLLMVNNLRDIDEDAAHGKRTLAVRLGERGARFALIACATVALVIAALLMTAMWPVWGTIMVLISVIMPMRMIRNANGGDFRAALSDAGRQTLLFAILFVICSCASSVQIWFTGLL